jgi:XTP/dITP diphosphohydrolase
MKIVYLTGNARKFEAAKFGLEGTDVELTQQTLDVPEIQSDKVEEVSTFKAKFGADKLGLPVVVTDGGFYFHGLNGFPGPYIKYINQWLSAKDLVKLMDGNPDRLIEAIECLTYCEPGKEPVTFVSVLRGQMATEPGQKGWSAINEVFIPEGYDKVSSEIPDDEMLKWWGKGLNWGKFKEYILAR